VKLHTGASTVRSTAAFPGSARSGSSVRKRVALLGALVALALPGSALAHIRTGAVAVDYRVTVSRAPAGLSARVYPGDRALRLAVAPGQTVVVLGYAGEPFLRLGSGGATIVRGSPTAAAAKARIGSRGRSAVWHDARLRGLRPGVRRGAWTIPLVVDGRRARLSGELLYVGAPPLWPWLALGVPFVLGAALLLRRRRPQELESAAIVLGLLVTASIVATAGGFAFDANASEGRWVEAADEVVFAAVALTVVARGRRHTRALAAGALGLLGLAVAVSKVAVFTHGVVLSLLPEEAARIAVALMLWSSAAATALGAAAFVDVLDD
jgi:hypothetical protein